MKGKSTAPKKTTPLAAAKEREAQDPSKMQLQILEHSPTSPMCKSHIELPRGWIVEHRPRVNSAAHPGKLDRYYYEPVSGRQFRSLTAVHKYLSEGMESSLTAQRAKPAGNENSMQIVPHISRSGTTFNLPPGWVVQEKSRSNVRYTGVVDRHYVEPGTGKRFRSMLAVERHLVEMKANAAASKVPKPLRVSGSWKKQKTGLDLDPMLDFNSPPAKVKWVLGGPGGSVWKARMGESVVPEFVQQTWSETFILSIQDKF